MEGKRSVRYQGPGPKSTRDLPFVSFLPPGSRSQTIHVKIIWPNFHLSLFLGLIMYDILFGTKKNKFQRRKKLMNHDTYIISISTY